MRGDACAERRGASTDHLNQSVRIRQFDDQQLTVELDGEREPRVKDGGDGAVLARTDKPKPLSV